MAIVIEEQGKRPGGLVGILLWCAVTIAIGAALYYIFFKEPAIVEIVLPAGFERIEELSGITLDPEGVLTRPEFQALREHVKAELPGETGRANPFLGL